MQNLSHCTIFHSRSNIRDITNAFKDMVPKICCFKHIIRFDIKPWWYVRCTCMWQLGDEYSCCCLEPPSPLNVCEEINSNSRTLIISIAREAIYKLFFIYSKLLDANLSQVWTSPWDSQHLILYQVVLLGWCIPNGSKDNWGWFSVSFTGEFLPNFNLTNMISTYTRDFSWEK